jgi:hypothetical protein
MDKKKILIGLGVLAAVGIGYYLWSKRKKPVTEQEVTDVETSVDVTDKPVNKPINKPAIKPANEPANEPATKPNFTQELESVLRGKK